MKIIAIHDLSRSEKKNLRKRQLNLLWCVEQSSHRTHEMAGKKLCFATLTMLLASGMFFSRSLQHGTQTPTFSSLCCATCASLLLALVMNFLYTPRTATNWIYKILCIDFYHPSKVVIFIFNDLFGVIFLPCGLVYKRIMIAGGEKKIGKQAGNKTYKNNSLRYPVKISFLRVIRH